MSYPKSAFTIWFNDHVKRSETYMCAIFLWQTLLHPSQAMTFWPRSVAFYAEQKSGSSGGWPWEIPPKTEFGSAKTGGLTM